MAETAIISEVAGVYSLDAKSREWNNLDGGVSRVAILHNYAARKFRLVALSAERKYVLNTYITTSQPLEQVSDVFVAWQAPDSSSYGLNFASATDCLKFAQSWKLTFNLAQQHQSVSPPGSASKAAAGAGGGDSVGAGVARVPKSVDAEIDENPAPISFGKAIQKLEDNVRGLLTASQAAVVSPQHNYDDHVSSAIGSMHVVMQVLLKLFISKIKQRRSPETPDKPTVVEKGMRDTYKFMKKTGFRGEQNDFALKAAVGPRRYLVQKVLIDKIHEGFSGTLLCSRQLLAALNAIKIIDNKTSDPGRQEGACMLQCCSVVLALTKIMKGLADSVATFGYIARHTSNEQQQREQEQASGTEDDGDTGGVPYWEECATGDFDASGRSHSLNRLIQKLTSTTSYDSKYLQTFITTYQSITVPRVLLHKLIERYSVPDSAQEQQPKAVQLRVAVVLKYWAEHHFEDFDEFLIAELYDFINNRLMRDGHSDMARALHNYVSNKAAELTRQVEVRFAVPRVIFNSKHKARPTATLSPIVLFYDMNPEDLAQQLTLIDFDLYRQIKPTELLKQAWNNKRLKWRAPNLLGMASRSTALSWWLASLILCQTTQAQRVHMMSKFVQVAEALRALNNYHSLMAVVAGLNTSPIHRLKRHWALVPKKRVKSLAALNDLMSTDGSYKEYRAALAKSKLPALPYVGVHLTDLTFTEDGNADQIEGKINYKKREQVFEQIEFLQRYQMTGYTEFRPVEPTCSYLVQLPSLTEDQLYAISLLVEPREPKK